MGISARATSLADRPRQAIRVTSARTRREDRSSISFESLADLGLSVALSRCRCLWVGLSGGFSNVSDCEGSAVCKNAPGNASQLVGERDSEHIVVEPFLSSLEPAIEAEGLAALSFDEHYPGRLNEQHTQVAIATLGYLAEDRAIPGGDLLGNEPQPGGEVATFGESLSCSDRGHHGTGDDRPDPGYTHQPLAANILARDGSNLVRQGLDALIELAPVARQVLDDVQHARRQDIRWSGQDLRQCHAQGEPPLAHGDAALQQEGADLIDDARALADQSFAHPV